MVACIIALFVFAVLSIFSAKYRALAKEAFRCAFLKITFRPCEGALDSKIKARVLSRLYDTSPKAAAVVGRHFEMFSWLFLILTVASGIIVAQGLYNIYMYGSCDPVNPEQCLIGAFWQQPICPNSFEGISVGTANAKVLIIEFGCFTCSYTKSSEGTIRNILEKYSNNVRYVFKTYPLPTHDNSLEAAAASICANNQGKYWEYRALLFADQAKIVKEGKTYLISLAETINMNTTSFTSCLSDSTTLKQIALMQDEAVTSKISGTPTFFVNHKYVKPDDLQRVVEEELKK